MIKIEDALDKINIWADCTHVLYCDMESIKSLLKKVAEAQRMQDIEECVKYVPGANNDFVIAALLELSPIITEIPR